MRRDSYSCSFVIICKCQNREDRRDETDAKGMIEYWMGQPAGRGVGRDNSIQPGIEQVLRPIFVNRNDKKKNKTHQNLSNCYLLKINE